MFDDSTHLHTSQSLPRRTFLTAAAATFASTALQSPTAAAPRDYGPSAAPQRYPDPDILSLDKRFDKYKLFNAPIQRLYTGTLWAEGVAWCGAGKFLVWSDIPNDRQLRWLDEDGHVSVYRKLAGYSNGNTFDYQGRQISFEHGNRRVVRYEPNGTITVLADKYQGKPLNAPNDGAVHPDGSIWFTDPGYGSLLNYEGFKGELFHKEAVYRIDPKTLKLDKLVDRDEGLYKPNGLCFSPDYKKLYVSDTGSTHYEGVPKNIRVFDIIDGKRLSNGREFANMKMTIAGERGKQEVAGQADGIRADIDGNIWAAMGWVGEGYDGVHIFAPDGARIGQILLPEICGNLCFGGPRRNRLFMAASQSLYTVYVETQAAHIA